MFAIPHGYGSTELWPNMSLPVQACFRTGYGVLLLATLFQAFRHGRRYFLSERWGGYAKSSPAESMMRAKST